MPTLEGVLFDLTLKDEVPPTMVRGLAERKGKVRSPRFVHNGLCALRACVR